MHRLSITVLTASLFAVGFPFAASAQETDTAPASATSESKRTESPARPIEEIVVRFQRSFFELRREIVLAEKNIFRLFNDNNSSDKMDIICKNRRHTSSHISQRICEPVFVSEMRTSNARDSIILGWEFLFNNNELLAEVGAEMEQLQAEIFGMVLTNEEYARALANYAELVEDFTELRAARWGRN